MLPKGRGTLPKGRDLLPKGREKREDQKREDHRAGKPFRKGSSLEVCP